ncbi:MAG: hypothetical protein E7479_09020 [Ruminococcaceae bacterium]|nr:hypothetical protein [Oscillospiraceae bacterium]
MKRIVSVLILTAMIFCCSGCGISFTAVKTIDDSGIYSKEEIKEAMDIVCREIEKSEGYILLKLEYDEEFSKKQMKYYEEQYDADEAIVLRSKFFVSKETEGALEKGETAKWSWILVRDKNGPWELMDAGYP